MEIIVANTSHIPIIQQLTYEVWPPTYVPIVGEVQVKYMLDLFYSTKSLTKQMEEYGHVFIVGYDNQVPVAFAAYSEVEPTVYKLHKLYILTTCQGKGIGREMVKYIIADLRNKGATTLKLNVNIYNYPAKSFYERLGFTHLLDEDIDIGSGYFMNDHVLQLTL